MSLLVVFAHGKESGPWGSKIRALANVAQAHGAAVMSPDYQGLDNADERVARLLGLPLPPHEKLVLVGSSMGGYVATVASMRLKPAGLFLMAPALYLDRPEYGEAAPSAGARHTRIVMGWQDELIPVGNVVRFAQAQRLPLQLVDDDHRLGASQTLLDLLFAQLIQQILTDPTPAGGRSS